MEVDPPDRISVSEAKKNRKPFAVGAEWPSELNSVELHGIGVESPTQIAVFVASTSIGGGGLGLVLLIAWVIGLVVANAMLALLAVFGLLHAERNSAVYRLIALFVGVASIAMGVLYLTGFAIT